MRGRSGHAGRSGRSGHAGHAGPSGHDARTVADGAVCFAVLDDAGNVLESSPFVYNLVVCGYTIVGARADCTFEPGEQISLRSVCVKNTGGITCPQGSLLSFPSTETVSFEDDVYMLPSLGPGESVTVDKMFTGRIFDVPEPVEAGPFLGKAAFQSKVTLLNRPFYDGYTATELNVSYPVRMLGFTVPTQLAVAERTRIDFPMMNLSSRELEKGLVKCEVSLGSNIRALSHVSDALGKLSFEVYGMELAAVMIDVQLSEDSELFQSFPWRAEVILRGKVIEFAEGSIRMAPNYAPSPTNLLRSADVLVFCSSFITRQEFVGWQSIFQALHLSVDWWDVERYGGISQNQSDQGINWRGRYQGATILLPHANELLGLLSPRDVMAHFYTNQDEITAFSESSLILHGVEARDLESFFERLFREEGKKLRFGGGEFAGAHWRTPKSKHAISKANEILTTLSEEDPLYFYRLSAIHGKFDKERFGKFYYGTADYEQFPLPKYARLIVIPGTVDGVIHSPIQVNSDEFNGLVGLLASLSFERRVNLELEQGYFDNVVLPDMTPLSWDELVTAACLKELENVWEFSATAEELAAAFAAFSRALGMLGDGAAAHPVTSVWELLKDESVSFRDDGDKKKLFRQYRKEWKKAASKNDVEYRQLDNISRVGYPLVGDTLPVTFPKVEVQFARGILEGTWETGDRETCELCEEKFHLFRSRHHCRNCNKLVCDSCSPNKLVVPSMGKKERRVCVDCESIIITAERAVQAHGEGASAPPPSVL